MALNPKFSNLAVNAEADAFGALLNNGYLRIYDGTQPATADTVLGAQGLLAELRFQATAFPPASAGVLTANALIGDAAANATGTATWFRALTADGSSVVYDGSVGTSDADCVINNTTIQAQASVTVASLTITVSKG